MKRFALGLGVVLVAGLAAAAPAPAVPVRGFVVQRQAERVQPPHVVGHPEMIARYAVVPARNVNYAKALDDAAKAKTIPFWNSSFTYDSKSYPYMMVGKSPFAKKAGTSKLKVQLYAYVLTFSDGTVFDPTKINSKCDTVSPINRLLGSPLYADSSITENGVNVGNIQYEDAEMRGEFWQYAQNEPKYHVEEKNAGATQVINLTVPAADGKTASINGFCNGKIGEVDINWLADQISTTNWKTTEIPVVFLYDVFQTESGSCCVLGYHGAYTTSGSDLLQTYSVSAYNDPGVFSAAGITDIHATSHEYGELLNDPTGENIVPAWGHIGQQSGCQDNLEVGDALTGTVFGSGITTNGFLYHPQELVYYSWFSRDNPSLGAGGLYSMNGTFKTAQGVCH